MKQDKVLHVYAGVAISLITNLLLFYLTDMPMLAVYFIGLSFGSAVGAIKEYLWDKWLGRGTFNIHDLYATIWGSLIGTVIAIAYTQYKLPD